MKIKFAILLLFSFFYGFSQNQSTEILVELDTKKHQLKVQQKIIFFNSSKDALNSIFLHNWANSYKNKKTPLSKRLLEDYDKDLYFAKKKNRGFSKIINISKDYNSTPFTINEKIPDIVKIELPEPLKPKDSISLFSTYIIQIPKDNYTHYGRNKDTYNLRYWYLIPAVYDKKWKTMSNFNMDDLFSLPTNYKISFKIPKNYFLESDLNLKSLNETSTHKVYELFGKNRTDIELYIGKKSEFKELKTNNLNIVSNLNITKLNLKNTTTLLERQVQFIEENLGKYPHNKILVNKITYDKNPVYGLNQLPKFFNPFNDAFEFDIKMFKALSHKFINNTIVTNRRKDTWLNDGIQTFLMMKYVQKYYPEIKAMGNISKIWGVKNYQLAKLNFNEKYTFVHQFATRKNLDQALNTSSDSLSTFNRKIVNKYKAGLGLQYLNDYLQNDIISESLKLFYKNNNFKKTSSNSFKNIITSKTNKDLSWFFGDYIQTNKKIDYTIKKVTEVNDSLKITIKNNKNFTAPIALYGIKNKQIKYKKWFANIDTSRTITIPKGDFDRVNLNFESIYPEINLNNNWKKIKSNLLNRPIQFRFLKDIDNPYYNQIFYSLEYSYNYYDGLILGIGFGNKTLLKKKWIYTIKPTYSVKSRQITGSASLLYTTYPEETKIYKFSSGISASYFHYAPNLSYQRISPFISFNFNRESLRDVGGKNIFIRYLIIKKETNNGSIALESNNYNVFNTRFSYSKPEIIKGLSYSFDFQLSKNFSKIAAEFRYRKLTDKNRQYDIRIYGGRFLSNKTTSNFFDFSLNRSSDYMFDYNYFGRSEDTGVLSQQIIIAEGGFKSFFKQNSANKWMVTTNGSISIWKWFELYGDMGIYKNDNFNPQFKYDTGVRLNFIHNFLEIYLPLQSSNGFEPNQQKYPEKIRFVLTLSLNKIYNFVKRGFY